MSAKGLPNVKIRRIAEEEVDRLVEEHPPKVLGMIRKVLERRVPKFPGRLPEDRWPALLEMARILLREPKTTQTDAARRVAPMCNEVEESTVVDYLTRAYRKYRTILEAELTAEDQGDADSEERRRVIEAAFAEDVEEWDL